MAEFQIPTPQEIRDQWFAEVLAEFPDTDPRLEKSLIGIIGIALSICVHGLYVFLAFIARQIFVASAIKEFLDRHGSEIGVSRKEATNATGDIDVTGVNGSVIPVDTQLITRGGVIYEVTIEQTIAAGVAVLPVESQGFGSDKNSIAAVAVSFVTPPVGLDSAGVVATGGISGGGRY